MFISPTIQTSYGSSLFSAPVPLVIPTDPGQALAFAVRTDQAADLALAEGRFAQAESLSHAAYEARCRAGVVR